jgi:hypothetical protein
VPDCVVDSSLDYLKDANAGSKLVNVLYFGPSSMALEIESRISRLPSNHRRCIDLHEVRQLAGTVLLRVMCHVPGTIDRYPLYTKISQLTSAQAKYLIRCNTNRLFAYAFLHGHRHNLEALSRCRSLRRTHRE